MGSKDGWKNTKSDVVSVYWAFHWSGDCLLAFPLNVVERDAKYTGCNRARLGSFKKVQREKELEDQTCMGPIPLFLASKAIAPPIDKAFEAEDH